MDETLLVPGKITGYRLWSTSPLAMMHKLKDWKGIPWGPDSYLFSLNQHVKWKVEKVEAKCQVKIPKRKTIKVGYYTPHAECPNIKCHCGLYAKYNLDQLIKNMFTSDKVYIIGAIEGWGRTILARSGFRCQYAKVTALLVNDNYNVSCMRHIGSFYNVPVYERPLFLQDAFPPSDLRALGVDGRRGMSTLYPPF